MGCGFKNQPKKDRQECERVPYAERQKQVLPSPLQGVEDRCVGGKRILCDEGSVDERIKHLKEWEKRRQSQ